MPGSILPQEIVSEKQPCWLDCVVNPSHVRSQPRILGILPGEGVGPEVVTEAIKVLEALRLPEAASLSLRIGGDIGFAACAEDGAVTERIAQFCQEIFDEGGAVFCGPGGGRFVYDLRRRFDLFCKLVPLHPIPALSRATPLRPEWIKGVDILVVRDNAGGIYQGKWGVRQDPQHGEIADHHFFYSEAQVERIVRVGARLAKSRRGRIDVIVKDGGVPTISDLWRRVAVRIAGEIGVKCVFGNADFAAYAMIHHPRDFDVLIAPNLVGDVLADLGAVFLGSRGLSFSGNFSQCGRAVFQTGHGAAYDLAGTGRANPVGQILSLAMMLRETYGLHQAAMLVERAVASVFEAGYRTDDLAEAGCHRVGTKQMGDLIAQAVIDLSPSVEQT